jgi:hypothetical protein
MPSETSKEALRKIIASALADLISYIGSTKNPIVVGAQYSNDRLITVFREWMHERKFTIAGAPETAKNWITMCNGGMFVGPDGLTPPSPSETTQAPEPPPPTQAHPSPPPPGIGEVKLPPPHADETLPDEGYFSSDEWKPEDKRKDNWVEEGEDWKKEGDCDDGFQPT